MSETRSQYVTPTYPPLICDEKKIIIPTVDMREYLELELRTAQTRVTKLREMLGKPKYCPRCHEEIE